MARKTPNLLGQRFGKLVIFESLGSQFKKDCKSKVVYWKAKCDCGNICEDTSSHIPHRTSCGCSKLEFLSKNKPALKHGKSGTSECNIWHGMRQRCYDSKSFVYHRYGGRGIKMCNRWLFGDNGLSGLQCFIQDMGDKPGKEYSIDRKDNDGDYTPDNCRWATKEQQMENMSSNDMITLYGKTQTQTKWRNELSMSRWEILKLEKNSQLCGEF